MDDICDFRPDLGAATPEPSIRDIVRSYFGCHFLDNPRRALDLTNGYCDAVAALASQPTASRGGKIDLPPMLPDQIEYIAKLGDQLRASSDFDPNVLIGPAKSSRAEAMYTAWLAEERSRACDGADWCDLANPVKASWERIALASAPPAPTPDAGSDLAKLGSKASSGLWSVSGVRKSVNEPNCVHIDAPSCSGLLVLPTGAGAQTLEALADAQFVVALVNAYRSGSLVEASASPPPGEDLAGQGEPVAWAYEKRLNGFARADGVRWVPCVSAEEPTDGPQVRKIRPLYAAPAPSRPADREEIARALARHRILHNQFTWNPREPLSSDSIKRAEDSAWKDWLGFADAVLALRDAPRDAGDGWLPIETAPKDGTSILIGRAKRGVMFAYWYDTQECFCEHHTGRDIWEEHKQPTHWRPLPDPPSPNPTDGTQDTDQGGGR